MNQGQYDGIVIELQKLNEQIDEIRRAVNRIDGRVKDISDRRVEGVVLDTLTEVLKENGS